MNEEIPTPRVNTASFTHQDMCLEGCRPDRQFIDAYLGRQLERELAQALAKIDDLTATSIHSCHDKCQRPNCVLRRELAAVTKERDEALNIPNCINALESQARAYRKEMTRIERKNESLVKQRDTLAEALEEIASGNYGQVTCVDIIAPNALAAVKGSKPPMEYRKAYICKYCQGVYADDPVSSCDCMESDNHPDQNHFIEGVIYFNAVKGK